MTVVYAESLFTLWCCAGLWWLYGRPVKSGDLVPNHRRLAAAVCFALATATRSNGSLLLIFQAHISALRVLRNWKRLPSEVVLFAVLAGLHLAPVMLHLQYAAGIYCVGAQTSPYCSNLLPNVYAYVQAKYW